MRDRSAHRQAQFLKRAAIIILLLAVALGGFLLYLDSQWRPVLARRIKETVRAASDSLYTIDFKDIDIGLATGDVSFKDVVFKPDLSVYKKLKAEGRAPGHLYQSELKNLVLKRVHPWKVYFRRELEMRALIISNPRIQVFFDGVSREDTLQKDTRTAYQYLSKYLRSVVVGSIVLRDVDFTYFDQSLDDPEVARVRNISVSIRDFRVDSASQYDRSRFYYTKDIFVQIKDHQLKTRNGLYNISCTELEASTAKAYVSLKGLKISPLDSDLVFSRKFKTQKERYSMVFDEVLFSGINYKKLNDKRQLAASRLLIRGSKTDIFLNKELPVQEVDKGLNYPQFALKRFKLNTIIDTVRIQDAEVRYTEYNPVTRSRGTVFFRHIDGIIANLTNDSLALTRNHWCNTSFSSLFMGEGLLKLKINFNLTSPVGEFNYSGDMGQMNARDLNQVLRPLAMVVINSGKVQKAVFSVKADYHRASGRMEFYYDDLRVGILTKEEADSRLKKNSIVSFFANTLIIKDSNPSPGEPLRISYNSFVRPDHASFFNLMWRTVFEGIKEAIGFTPERGREIQRNFDKMKISTRPERIERREKREERREKREERRENNN